MDFQLAEMKQKFEHDERKQINEISREKQLAEIASKREVEFRRIDSGMIEHVKKFED
jgi:ribosomal protein L20A (L18A)